MKKQLFIILAIFLIQPKTSLSQKVPRTRFSQIVALIQKSAAACKTVEKIKDTRNTRRIRREKRRSRRLLREYAVISGPASATKPNDCNND